MAQETSSFPLPCCFPPIICPHNPPYEQLLVGVGWVPWHLLSSSGPGGGGGGAAGGAVLHFVIITSVIPPIIHSMSSCSWGWRRAVDIPLLGSPGIPLHPPSPRPHIPFERGGGDWVAVGMCCTFFIVAGCPQ
ncbi:hypothetical protein L208DRAFT_1405178 [Tricholoma matsutake]|nr:hypothetical protein L208DRAFT_1405178 [Tricholoma matsutake 945]